jgi:hypothetical protein
MDDIEREAIRDEGYHPAVVAALDRVRAELAAVGRAVATDEPPGLTHQPQLLHHREVVCQTPAFDCLAVLEPQDPERRYIDLPAGRWYPEELTLMGSCTAPVGNREGTFSEHEVERILVIREGGARHLDARPVSRTTAALKARSLNVIHQVLRDEFVNEF